MTTVLATKLFAPWPRANNVRRARLHERLAGARGCSLVLVSAPAGFGKTSLVGDWVRTNHVTCAWLSLEDRDDDPMQFWQSLVASIRSARPEAVQAAHDLLNSGYCPPSETVAGLVANGLAALGDPLAIVLDDYNSIRDQGIHDGVSFLVAHLPREATMFVLTRADPPWPLARLRAGGALLELRAADLRFNEDEARTFLNSAGLELSSDLVRLLELRTEGWIAGLQLAALSLRDRPDVDQIVQSFAGTHRFVIDYLVEEVLDRQPEEVRDFLLRTSILNRLSADLCNSVVERTDGQQMLESLERGNLFVEPLDTDRRWYRYHQLFAEVLRSRFAEASPQLLPALHKRAAAWLEKHGLESDAVQHALDSGQPDYAADLTARLASATFLTGNQMRFVRWVERLPAEVVAARPRLALGNAWAHFVIGDWDGMVPALEIARRAVDVASPEEQDAYGSQLDGVCSWVAYQTGDLPAAVALSTAALGSMPPDSLVSREVVALARGYGLLLLDEVSEARSIGLETAASSQRARDAVSESLAIGLEAQAALIEGHLTTAERLYGRAISAGTISGEPLPPVGIAQVQLGEVLRERNSLAAGCDLLQTAIAACEGTMGLPEWVFEGHVTLARILLAQGDPLAARAAAEQADRVFDEELAPRGMEPIVQRAAGYRLRLWLESGDVGRAATWLRERGVEVGTTADHRNRLFPVVLRLLLAQGEPESVVTATNRMRDDPAPLAKGLLVEAGVARAAALQAIGADADAAECLAELVETAASHGFARVFVSFGPALADLLRQVTLRGAAARRHGDRLLAAFGLGESRPAATARVGANGLNERELEILRLFANGLSNAEIADQLYLSVNTVKWHARNLYGKLGVGGRTHAVARASALGIAMPPAATD